MTDSSDLPAQLDSSARSLPTVSVHVGDCLEVLRTLADSSVDAVVTDPPYAIRAPAGRGRACGPPGLAASPGIGETRTPGGAGDVGRETNGDMLGMQSAGWHERQTHSRGYVDNDPDYFEDWCAAWAAECLRVLKPGGHLLAFGGTPTWHRLTRGVERAGFTIRGSMAWLYATGFPKGLNVQAAINGSKSIGGSNRQDVSAQDCDALPGASWAGWGTALKPAHEPIVLARKPVEGTVAANVSAYGTGALNIDGCRVGGSTVDAGKGRWPSDVFLDPNAAAALDAKAGGRPVADFFWHAKPPQAERVTVGTVTHPTVKPVDLMRELVRLVTPPGGTVLDPFAGSGTTVEACVIEGFSVLAIEREPVYAALIRQRVDRRRSPVTAVLASGEDPGLFGLWADPVEADPGAA